MSGISGIAVKSYMNMGTPDPANRLTGAGTDWKLMPCVRTEDLDLSPNEIEANCRNGNAGWEAAVPGLKSGEISMTYLYSKTDPQFQKLKDAVMDPFNPANAIEMALMFTDIATAGDEGFVSLVHVIGFSVNRDYDSAVEATITMKPYSDTSDADSANHILPSWETVPAPGP